MELTPFTVEDVSICMLCFNGQSGIYASWVAGQKVLIMPALFLSIWFHGVTCHRLKEETFSILSVREQIPAVFVGGPVIAPELVTGPH
jgi:hypothetical protein